MNMEQIMKKKKITEESDAQKERMKEDAEQRALRQRLDEEEEALKESQLTRAAEIQSAMEDIKNLAEQVLEESKSEESEETKESEDMMETKPEPERPQPRKRNRSPESNKIGNVRKAACIGDVKYRLEQPRPLSAASMVELISLDDDDSDSMHLIANATDSMSYGVGTSAGTASGKKPTVAAKTSSPELIVEVYEKGRNPLNVGDLKAMKVNEFYKLDDFKQKNASKAFTTLFSQTWAQLIKQPRYYCLYKDCNFANYIRANMLGHCRKVHKKDADCFEDRIENWKQNDVKKVSQELFGNPTDAFQMMPQQWKCANKELYPSSLRTRMNEIDKIHQKNTKNEKNAKTTKITENLLLGDELPETEIADSDKQFKDESKSKSDSEVDIECHICNRTLRIPNAERAGTVLAHFIVHYTDKYGVGRFSCRHCDKTSARREDIRSHCLTKHDDVDEAEAFIDNITSFPIDYVTGLSRAVFGSPNFILNIMPVPWKTQNGIVRTSSVAALAATKIANGLKDAKSIVNSTASSKCYTENSVNMLEAQLSQRNVEAGEIDSITQKLLATSVKKMNGCNYLILEKSRLPKARKDTTRRHVIDGCIYVGVTCEYRRANEHFRDARSGVRNSNSRYNHKPVIAYLQNAAANEAEFAIVRIGAGHSMEIAETVERCLIRTLWAAGRLENVNSGTFPQNFEPWENDVNVILDIGQFYLNIAVEMTQSGTIEIVNSQFIANQSLMMRDCTRVDRGQASRYDFVQNHFPPRSRMTRRDLPYNPLQIEEVATNEDSGENDE